MKDILEKIIARLPLFGSRLIELLSGPKRFIAGQNLSSPDTEVDAFIFLGISLVISLVAQIPMMFATFATFELLTFSAIAFQGLVGFAITVVALDVSWKIAGGRLAFKTYVIVSCYYAGVATLLFTALFLLMGGILRAIDPELYSQMMMQGGTSAPAPVLLPLSALTAIGVAVAVMVGLSYLWLYCVWGAYRTLNGLSKSRSAVAFVIFAALAPVLFIAQGLMVVSILPAKPAVHSLPADLLGAWELRSITRSSTDIEQYRFNDNGTYLFVGIRTVADGRCTKTTQYRGFGNALVKEGTLTLTPVKREETTEDSCVGAKSTAQKDLTKETYRFELRRHPSGSELCLAGRFGERCFKPVQGVAAADIPSGATPGHRRLSTWGAPGAPQAPQRSGRPGTAGPPLGKPICSQALSSGRAAGCPVRRGRRAGRDR